MAETTGIDVEALIEENAAARAELMQAIDALPPERRAEVVHGDWAISDVVAHVATRKGEIKGWDERAWARRKARWRTSDEGCQASQKCRRRVEEIFGWMKTIGGLRKARFVARWKIQEHAYAAAATFNFIRLAKIEAG